MQTPGFDSIASSEAMLDRLASSRDLWPRDTLAVRDHTPRPVPARIFWPESEAEILSLLQEAARLHKRVIAYGAGSGVCGGARAEEEAWMLDLKRWDQIGPVDVNHWTVQAGAGVIGQVLEDNLAAQGWTNAHSPSSIGCSTVGGWAAARGAGQLSSAYGVFDDMILGLDAVIPGVGAVCAGLPGPDSPAKRVSDAWIDHLVGSEGALGVITRVRLRVHPLPATRQLRGWWMPDVPTALDAMRQVMQAELWPFAMRLYDPVDTLIGGSTQPKDAHAHAQRKWYQSLVDFVDREPRLRQASLAIPLSVPRLLQRVAEGLTDGCLLVLGFEGESALTQAREQAASAILSVSGRDLGRGPGERWWASRHAVSYKLMPLVLHGGFVDTMEIAAPWSRLPEIYTQVRKALRPWALTMAHFSHAYPEGGCMYLSMTGRGDTQTYDKAWQAALQTVVSLGASVSHHHGIGRLKASAASRSTAPVQSVFESLKRRFDPDGILPDLFSSAPAMQVESVAPFACTPEDGLVRVPADRVPAALEQEEARWPWDRAGMPTRLGRNAWESSLIAVSADLDGARAVIGRGPREAVGPDTRRTLCQTDPRAEVILGIAAQAQRWMGRVRVRDPWACARKLWRADLRMAQVGVEDGALYIGFRGPTAEACGQAAGELLGTPFEPCAWRVWGRWAGEVVPCEEDDPRAVAATQQFVLRPPELGEACGE